MTIAVYVLIVEFAACNSGIRVRLELKIIESKVTRNQQQQKTSFGIRN
jgi:hypothetical protein